MNNKREEAELIALLERLAAKEREFIISQILREFQRVTSFPSPAPGLLPVS